MFKRLLRPFLTRRSLYDGYRQAEVGQSGSESDLAARQAFDADQRVIDEFTRLASLMRPSPPEGQRAQLLGLLAEMKNQRSHSKPPLTGWPASRRAAAIAAATILLTSGVVAASAAPGGIGNLPANVQDVLGALHITDRPPDEVDNQSGQGQHDSSNNPAGLDTTNDHANDPAGDGIDNASDQGLDHANDHALDGANNGGTSTPSRELPGNANDNASEGSNHATQQSNNGEQQLPTQANDHADGGRGNASVPDAAERTPPPHR